MTAVRTGDTLDMRAARVGADRVGAWITKAAALRTLADLRKRGLNVADDVAAHPVVKNLTHVWVLGRADNFNGVTFLMTRDGRWVPGRLDGRPCFHADGEHEPACKDNGGYVTWEWLGGAAHDATFTHVTRTVPYHGRHEQFRTKSNGSCGRWVMTDDSVALCTCGWERHGQTRAEAQGAARVHRAEVEALATVGGAR